MNLMESGSSHARDSLRTKSQQFEQLISKTEITSVNQTPLDSNTGVQLVLDLLHATRTTDGRVGLVGNGGSAAVASHVMTDLVNKGGFRSLILNEPALLTCFSNDYGYENAFARLVSLQATKSDLLIALSSSGRSKNILNAVHSMHQIGGKVITLSGFDRDNMLRAMGDLNLWLDSHDYGFVEVGHLFILHYVADCLALSLPSRSSQSRPVIMTKG